MSHGGRSRAPLVLSIVALLVALGGSGLAAVAAIPQDGRFTACYQTSDSLLNRIVLFAEPDENCPNTYARVTWSQSAGAGAAGPPGPQGPAGVQGPVGPPGAAAPTRRMLVTVSERRLTLRNALVNVGNATARCPRGSRAVGGGGRIHSDHHEPVNSFPLVNKQASIGWTLSVRERRSFTWKAVDGGLVETYKSFGHRHKLSRPPLLALMDPRGFGKRPAEVTVYAICLSSSTP